MQSPPTPPEYKPTPDIIITDSSSKDVGEELPPHNNHTRAPSDNDDLVMDVDSDSDVSSDAESNMNNHIVVERTEGRTEKQSAVVTGNQGNQNARSRAKQRPRVRGDGAGNGRVTHADVQEYNANLRRAAIKEVRKPGKGKFELFELMQEGTF